MNFDVMETIWISLDLIKFEFERGKSRLDGNEHGNNLFKV